jgi:hypothetical protein
MPYLLTLTPPVNANTHRVSIRAEFGSARASHNERVRVRRRALAVSEEARIHAQMRHNRARYQHIADYYTFSVRPTYFLRYNTKVAPIRELQPLSQLGR